MISFFFPINRKAGSGRIRGKQIGEYLGARLNPEDGYQDDVCIYVKIPLPEDPPPNTYLDIMDAWQRIHWLVEHPKTKVICMSKASQNFMHRLSIKNTFLIPQHHCNYDREQRKRNEVTVVGHIGRQSAFFIPYKDMAACLNEMGLDFRLYQDYDDRMDVVKFYKEIDIQVCWRTHRRESSKLRSPLKLANACSFGIPTVSFPETNYVEEFDGYFLPAPTVEDLFVLIKKLKNDNDLYQSFAIEGLEKAEEYHIEKIAQIYRELDDNGNN